MKCGCGCGRETEIATKTRWTSSGMRHVAGQPKPFWKTHGATKRQKTVILWQRGSDGRWLVATRTGVPDDRWARVVVRNAIGRELRSSEVVHHINGDKTDDRLENLSVMEWGEHSRAHNQVRYAERPPCKQCGESSRGGNYGYCKPCWSRSPERREYTRQWHQRRVRSV